MHSEVPYFISQGDLLRDPVGLVGYVGIFLLSLSIHESAHAWSAHKLGDPTAYLMGRVTLNPIKHLDLMWSFILPLSCYLGSGGSFIFGGGKPVPVNVFHLRSLQRDNWLVSMAGPASNVLIALVLLALLWVYPRSVGKVEDINYWILFYGFLTNVGLAAFNALPVPPLDGFSNIVAVVDRTTAERLLMMKEAGMIILVIVLMTGAHRAPLDWMFLKVFQGLHFLQIHPF